MTPGNEDKRPVPKTFTSSPLTTGQGNKGGQSVQKSKNQALKARLLEIFDEIENEESNTPPRTLNVNTVSTAKIVEPMSAAKGTTVQDDDVQEGPSRLTSQPRWARSQQFELDFPKGL